MERKKKESAGEQTREIDKGINGWIDRRDRQRKERIDRKER
jgi:hypothetical protein